MRLLNVHLKPGHPDPGGDGLRHRHAGRAPLPRRPHHRDLRGHQRDPEARHRRADPEGVPAVDAVAGRRPNYGPGRLITVQ